MSATIRLESSPPLSIAPSGTSLMSRAGPTRSRSSQQLVRVLLSGAAGVGRGLG